MTQPAQSQLSVPAGRRVGVARFRTFWLETLVPGLILSIAGVVKPGCEEMHFRNHRTEVQYMFGCGSSRGQWGLTKRAKQGVDEGASEVASWAMAKRRMRRTRRCLAKLEKVPRRFGTFPPLDGE